MLVFGTVCRKWCGMFHSSCSSRSDGDKCLDSCKKESGFCGAINDEVASDDRGLDLFT